MWCDMLYLVRFDPNSSDRAKAMPEITIAANSMAAVLVTLAEHLPNERITAIVELQRGVYVPVERY